MEHEQRLRAAARADRQTSVHIGQEEFFREYRAFGAEEEPWREEVFAQELAAAFMASSILSGSNFDVRPAEMEKEVPGGVFSMFYNSLNLGKYSKGA